MEKSLLSRIEEACYLMRMTECFCGISETNLTDCALSSSRLDVLYKKAALKNFTNFKEKHLQWSLFLNKAVGLGL